MLLDMDVGLGPADIALDGNPSLLWPNGWMDQDGTWSEGRPWPMPHYARWGFNSPPQKGGRDPRFSAHFCCGQTAGCIRIPLGIEVSLSPGDFVLDGDLASPSQSSAHIYFGETAAWTNMPLGTEVGLGYATLC